MTSLQRLKNGIVGLGIAPAWLMASQARVGEDGGGRLRGGLDDGAEAPGRTRRQHELRGG
jgi:hypothetical protein